MSASVGIRTMLVGAVLFLVGCSTTEVTSRTPVEGFPLSLQKRQIEVAETPGGPTLDQLFDDIAEDVPAFAGFYTDTDGRLVIQMVDTSHSSDARQVVAARSGLEQARDAEASRIHPVRFSFRQLKSWLHALLQEGVPAGMYTSDIDERANQLRFGVADAATATILEERAVGHQVPVEAVAVRQMLAFRRSTDYLTSALRPVMGGLTIVTTAHGCSLGFKVKISNVHYLITNAHCTSNIGQDDDDSVGQPLLQSNYFVGTEFADPGFASGGSCESGHTCRYSDAAIFTCDTAGFCPDYTIARTTSEYTGSDWDASGSSQLTTEPWYVTAELSNASLTQGTSVSKVGQSSGWTGGEVEQTCFTTYNFGGQNKDLLCQFSATFVSRNGDSGSPVFKYNPTLGTASLAGIYHSFGGGVSVFSPISGVKADLGAMTVYSLVY